MKTTLRTLLAFSTLALSFAAVPAFAGDSEPLRVTVPFAFKAGKTMLPAGDYTISNEDSRVVMIKGSAGSAIVLTIANTDADGTKPGLSFDKDESGYCLRSIQAWGKGTSTLLSTGDASGK